MAYSQNVCSWSYQELATSTVVDKASLYFDHAFHIFNLNAVVMRFKTGGYVKVELERMKKTLLQAQPNNLLEIRTGMQTAVLYTLFQNSVFISEYIG